MTADGGKTKDGREEARLHIKHLQSLWAEPRLITSAQLHLQISSGVCFKEAKSFLREHHMQHSSSPLAAEEERSAINTLE